MPLPMYQEKKTLTSGSSPKYIVGIAAGKGGVGKSTVAVNLSLALKELGLTVGLMDTDVYGPSVRKMLPEDSMPVQKDGKISPALCCGIRMISMAYFRQESQAAVVRAPIANSIVTQFLNQVEWGDIDILLMDFPPGTGDIQLTLAQKAKLSGAILVSTPQEVALMDVKKTKDMFSQVKIPIIGIIENMSAYYPPNSAEPVYLFGRNGGVRLARDSGVPLLGQVPVEPMLCQKSDLGESIFSDPSTISIAKIFLDMAKQLHHHLTAMKTASANCLDSFEIKWKEEMTQ